MKPYYFLTEQKEYWLKILGDKIKKYFAECLAMTLGKASWHSAKKPLCRVPAVGSRQRLTAVSFGTAADGPLPRAPFAECLTLDKVVFAEYRSVPSVQLSAKHGLPSA